MKNFSDGGYTAFRALTPDEKKLFEDVIQSLIGVGYEPLAVAAQVVAGTNYAFFCRTRLVRPDALYYNTVAIIHQPLPDTGKPSILMSITTVKVI